MNRNEKVLSDKRKAKRVNSEPDALSVLRSKERMVSSLSEGNSHETDTTNQGLMTKIKGLKSDIMKRVSRVMSDEDMRNLRALRSRLSHIEEPHSSKKQPHSSPPRSSTSAAYEVQDPNLRQKKSEQSLHDVYKQLYLRRITSVDPPSQGVPQLTNSTTSGVPATKVTEDSTKTEQSDNEIYSVLEALKEGRPSGDIPCSRNIVQRTVTLNHSTDLPMQRHEQGGQFGLRIVGGKKTAGGMLCAFVASIAPDSPASRAPDLNEGDLVLRWNETMLIGMTFEECQECLDDCETVTLVVSNFLRGSYRRYRPRSSKTTGSGSVESILKGTTHKWITLTRRGMLARQADQSKSGDSSTIEEKEDEGKDEETLKNNSTKIKVELRLVHVAMENRLSVHLIQAANIPYKEGLEGLDMFCKLYLSPDSNLTTDAKKRSKTAVRTYNPYWNQHFEYQPITSAELKEKKLEVTLMTHHWLQKDHSLGQIEVHFSDKKVLSGQASWFYLHSTPDLTAPVSPEKVRENTPEHDSNHLGSKSLSEMVKEKVTIQHRITFSTFDSKKEIVPDIRRTASDTTKHGKHFKARPRPSQTGDEDSSDNVFTSTSLQSHLSNIKESEEPPRPPIQVRGSPRRRPKVIRNKSSAREYRDSEPMFSDPETYRRVCSNDIITPENQLKKYRRGIRSNSEDLTMTKHRILPKVPARSKKSVLEGSLTLPNKKTLSPLVVSQGHNFTHTRVTLTTPSSESCGNSSTDSNLSSTRALSLRPPPEGQPRIGTGDPSSNLGPGQISVECKVPIPGSLVLTLGIHQNLLTLEVVQAYGLPVRQHGTPPDTYVKTYVLFEENRSHKEKTSTVRNNCSPVFNERITYILNPKNNKTLQVMVWDEVGTLRKNCFLGEILIDLNYIATSGPLQGRYKLYPSSVMNNKPP